MNSRIKLSARKVLSGSYVEIIPVLTAIIFLRLFFSLSRMAFYTVCQYSAGPIIIFFTVSFLLAVILISPMKLWLEIKHLSLAKRCKKREHIGLKYAAKSCLMSVSLMFLKFFWLLVFELVPAVSAIAFFSYLSVHPLSLRAVNTVFLGIILLAAAGIFFYFSAVQRYSAAMFYLACYENIGAFDAIKESVRKTKGKQGKTLIFKLGFLPWFLLCIGIAPAFFVIPYYKQSITCRFLNDR